MSDSQPRIVQEAGQVIEREWRKIQAEQRRAARLLPLFERSRRDGWAWRKAMELYPD